MAVLQGIQTKYTWAAVHQSFLCCGRRVDIGSTCKHVNVQRCRLYSNSNYSYTSRVTITRSSCTIKYEYSSSRPSNRSNRESLLSFKNCQKPHCLHASTPRRLQCLSCQGIEKNVSKATIQALLCSIIPVNLLSAPASVALVDENGHYSPSPMESPSPEIWFGFIVGIIPFIIASYEFGKRILIQRRCDNCGGRGLVKKGKYWKKCTKVCLFSIFFEALSLYSFYIFSY